MNDHPCTRAFDHQGGTTVPWIIGASIASVTTVSLATFFWSRQAGFWLLALLAASYLPTPVTVPRRKRVRKKESAMLLASQNLEDFDQEGVREMTKPLFSIPPHQFLFNAGSIDKRSYMDMLQLEESEYNLIKFPQRGVCLYKCGNERYLLEVHAPAYKEKLFGTAGGR